jgi:hypothetical protein
MKIQNLLIIVSLILIPASVLAGLLPCGGPGHQCTFEDICPLFVNVISYLLSIAGIVGVIILIIGGVWFLFAGADPEMIEKGRKVILTVIIALLVIFLSKILLCGFLNTIGAGSEIRQCLKCQ